MYVALISQVKNNPVLLKQREIQIYKRRDDQYLWQKYEDGVLPSCLDKDAINNLPDQQFERVKNFDFTEGAVKSGLFLAKQIGSYVAGGRYTMDEYASLATELGKPDIDLSAVWKDDVEFGWQMLNGVNPVVIEKAVSLPSNFHVTDEEVGQYLEPGKTLDDEMKVLNLALAQKSIPVVRQISIYV